MRPNADYELSKPDKEPGIHDEIVYHYNRERRLEKAPQAVRDLANRKPQKFSLFRPLVADKPRATLFFTILLMCAAIFIISIINKVISPSYALDGNKIEVMGTRYEGTTIVLLRKTVKNASTGGYYGAVDVAITPFVENGETAGDFADTPNVFYHRVYFSNDLTEEYRFAVPFDTPQQVIVLQTDISSLNIKFSPD